MVYSLGNIKAIESERGVKVSQDYLDFIDGVKRKTGIDLSLYKEAQMKRRIATLYEKKGFENFRDYLNGLLTDKNLLDEFLDRMTINVSEFYRNPERWEVLQQKIIPELLTQNKNLKVWSAACSTGEEPYTLAMVLSNFKPFSEISILATDLDKNVIARAKRGVYPERSVKEVPESMLKRHFTKEGSLYKVDEAIKRAVTFKQQNLLLDKFDNNFDLIVCRNVMIYFTDTARNELHSKFNAALKRGGYLFVGSTEQIFDPAAHGFNSAAEKFFYKK